MYIAIYEFLQLITSHYDKSNQHDVNVNISFFETIYALK